MDNPGNVYIMQNISEWFKMVINIQIVFKLTLTRVLSLKKMVGF